VAPETGTTNDERESWMSIDDVRRTVGTLAGSATTSAASVARHPLRATARAAGFAKGTVSGTAHVATGLVRRTSPASDPTPPAESETAPAPSPAIDPVPDLPEPVVIEAADPTGEEVHHEPREAGRGPSRGAGAGNRDHDWIDEEVEDGAGDVPAGATALVDDDLEPLIPPGSGAAARKQADQLARAADPRPE
jgi:hypothetical protein